MPVNQHSFVIPVDQSVPQLVSLLEETFSLRAQAKSIYHRVFYDTFDWRLTRNGSSLELHDDGRSPRIYWRADKDSRAKIQLGFSKVPRLAADLPACEFRLQLQQVASVRELLPRIKIRVKRQSFVVLDENDKVVVRLYFDVYWYSSSKLKAARILTQRLVTTEVKGYAEDYQRIRAFFTDTSQAVQLQPAQDNVLKLALITSGISTNEHNTSLNLRLDPDMPAVQASKMILLRLLEIVQQNTAGSIKGRDKGYIDDYRIALEKTGFMLEQLKRLDPQAVSTEYEHFFSLLDKLTEPVRDLDRFLVQMDEYQFQCEPSDWQQLNPLYDFLIQSRAEVQDKLAEELKSSQYRKTIKQWHEALIYTAPESGMSDRSEEPIYKLADELLADVNRQALTQGKAVIKKGDPAIQHAESSYKLRKTLQQLNYLSEFFSSLYPAVEMRVLTRVLRELQDSFGLCNDRCLQIDTVKAFIERSNNKQAIKAAEQIIQMLEHKQKEAVASFKEIFKSYAAARNQKKLKELFVDYHQGQMKL